MMLETKQEPRQQGQKSVLSLACKPIENVRIGIIGLGARGYRALNRLIHIEGVEIMALCDMIPQNIENSQKILRKNHVAVASSYSGQNAWMQLCDRNDIDLVYICTDWQSHTQIAVYAMEHDKHAAIEVPAAMTIEQCWQLVDTAERKQRHCIMLENCCYDFFELATLNMAQQGLFGEIMHAEGAYIHDLREKNFTRDPESGFYGNWQRKFITNHTGNPYPTHGLGPICQIMNIHRGDKMNYLVSVSTKQAGLTQYAIERFGEKSPEAMQEYKQGDMNTTIIKTEKGKTMVIQHDITSPRPYSRVHLISGTKGFAQKYPKTQIALSPNASKPLKQKELKSLLMEYEHPFAKEMGKKAIALCKERAMDYMMDSRIIFCLRNGLPLDQDVYDAAEWSSIVALSQMSVLNNGEPVEIPDFTRGLWNESKGLSFFDL
ncbi:MAG: Gfo/Idh/MocA family oxidoreductase [Bacteroidales bacterium]|nr:Gfo/Idh/MocA family oxidoreductase [Bacteroidales bacterium]MDD3906965.1 Gfo/Idh/MocA family oxidoreductase [Bacteroidales bacterium]